MNSGECSKRCKCWVECVFGRALWILHLVILVLEAVLVRVALRGTVEVVGVPAVGELLIVGSHIVQSGAAPRVRAVERLVEHQLARVVVALARHPRDGVGQALFILDPLVPDHVVVANLNTRRVHARVSSGGWEWGGSKNATRPDGEIPWPEHWPFVF